MKFKRKAGSQPWQREWLNHMPDAGIFKDGWGFACDANGEWLAYDSEPFIHDIYWFNDSGYLPLDFIDMPELEGEEWKHSSISVEELAEWQSEHK